MASSSFRRNVGQPLLMLLGILLIMALFLFGLWMIFLAIPSPAALVLALGVAAYILFVSAKFGENRRVSSRALGVALVGSFVALGAAGLVAFQLGPRDLEAEEAEEEAPADEAPEEEAAELPEDALVWVAVDNDFTESPDSAPAGEVTIALDNEGNATHNVDIDELGVHVEAEGGEVAFDTFEVEPGTYEYICDIPGHEQTMNGEITFE